MSDRTVEPVDAPGPTRRGDRGIDRSEPGRGDHGQVVPLMAGVAVVIALMAVGLAHVGTEAIDRARAQNAADAAALGAALRLDPVVAERLAGAVAERNGAHLAGLHREGPVTVVEVRLGDQHAAAAARPVAARSTNAP